jgi:hypothetical protein
VQCRDCGVAGLDGHGMTRYRMSLSGGRAPD